MSGSDSETARWVSIGQAAALRSSSGACVTVAGRELAVFALEDGWAALDNSCPHRGAALAEGVVEGATVSCPWHGWRFDVRTGACLTAPQDGTRAYRVREHEGNVEVELP